jgi:hypothetical protein
MQEETARDLMVPENVQLPIVGERSGAAGTLVPLKPMALEVYEGLRQRIETFFGAHMREVDPQQADAGGDYGVLPGTKTRALWQPGALKVMGFFGLIERPVCTSAVENWETPLFHYDWRVDLLAPSGAIVASGIGSANSKETKWRWRYADRVCPECQTAAIIKGKAEFGGGWICWKSRGGCGAKFPETDARIKEQQIGRQENDAIYDQVNTIKKMGRKRARVEAVATFLRACGYDIEAGEEDDESGERKDESRQHGKAHGTRSATGVSSTGAATVSEAEQKRLVETAAKHGHPWAAVVRWVADTFQVDLLRTRIPTAHYAAILERVSQDAPLAAADGAGAAL